MYKIIDVEGYEQIQEKLNVSSLTAKVIKAFNYEKTLNSDLKDPFLYVNIDKVANKIFKHLKDKIVVYGDYDADGICSTSILIKTLQSLGNDAGFYIPNRYKEGYGLNNQIISQMADKGYKILIAVDCGIKNNEEIKLANSLGMEVIVLDHHELGENLPDAYAILHPTYSNFTNYNMCGASVAFNLSRVLLGAEDEYLLALAGIATLADVMPLVDENKLLVNKALHILNKNKYIQFDLLCNFPKKYNQTTLNFTLIPKINAVGRISKQNETNLLVKYFTSNDRKTLNEIASFVEESNDERKSLSKSLFEKMDEDYSNNKIITVYDDKVLEGLSGLIASFFVNKYGVPAIVFAKSEDEDIYKGSGRSVEGISLIDLLDNQKQLIIQYGGHQKAAGMSIAKDNFDAFCQNIEKEVSKIEIKKQPIEVIEVSLDELTYQALNEINEFGPFGEANPEPKFVLKNVNKNDFRFSKDGKHILITLSNSASLVAFNQASIINKNEDYYDFIFTIEENTYKIATISCKSSDCFIGKNKQLNA